MKKNFIFLLLSAVLLASCSKETVKIAGSGATFPAPFYNIVFKKYTEKGGEEVTYGGVGSGGGIRNLRDKVVDFGASDVFLSDKEMAEMNADVIHLPVVLGGIVMAYNLDGVKDLKLNAEIITDIYTGKIKSWDDAKIKALNPELTLPAQAITPVYRSDGSGTTAVFSEYMSKVNDTWKNEIGQGKSLKFNAGISGKGNPGVAGLVTETKGAIGYIGSEYALALDLPVALLQNSSGKFVKADEKSISLAADVQMPADTRTTITNSPNPDAYPISTFTWIIVYKDQNYNGRTLEQAKALKNLMKYVLSDEGQAIAVKTSYAPLSGNALQVTKAALETMTFDGKPIE